MTEEQQFQQWFEAQRRASFATLKDYGDFSDHPNWGIGAYNDMRKAWMAARAFTADGFEKP